MNGKTLIRIMEDEIPNFYDKLTRLGKVVVDKLRYDDTSPIGIMFDDIFQLDRDTGWAFANNKLAEYKDNKIDIYNLKEPISITINVECPQIYEFDTEDFENTKLFMVESNDIYIEDDWCKIGHLFGTF